MHCVEQYEHGGSFIYVQKNIVTKELNCLHELGEEKNLNCH